MCSPLKKKRSAGAGSSETGLEKAAQQQKDHESSAKRVEKQLAKLNEPQQQTAYLGEKGLQVHKGGVFTDSKGQKTFVPAGMSAVSNDHAVHQRGLGTKRFAKNARWMFPCRWRAGRA